MDANKLKSFKDNLKQYLTTYKNVFNRDFMIYEKLDALSKIMPNGVWLDEIEFDRKANLIKLRGSIFLQDERKIADAPYFFISNLKGSPLFSNKIDSISVISLRSAFQKEYKVNKFEIEARIKK